MSKVIKCPPANALKPNKRKTSRTEEDYNPSPKKPNQKERLAAVNAHRAKYGHKPLAKKPTVGILAEIEAKLAATPEGTDPWTEIEAPAKKKRKTSTPTAPGVTGDEDYIVLKHLCREFDCDGFKMRQLLRKEFTTPSGKRWKWDQNNAEDAKQLKAIRAYLKKRLTKS